MSDALAKSVESLADGLSIKSVLASDLAAHAATLCGLLGVRAVAATVPAPKKAARRAPGARKPPRAGDTGLLADEDFAAAAQAACARAARGPLADVLVARLPPAGPLVRAAAGLPSTSEGPAGAGRGARGARGEDPAGEVRALCRAALGPGLLAGLFPAPAAGGWGAVLALTPAVEAAEGAVRAAAAAVGAGDGGGEAVPAALAAAAEAVSALAGAAAACRGGGATRGGFEAAAGPEGGGGGTPAQLCARAVVAHCAASALPRGPGPAPRGGLVSAVVAGGPGGGAFGCREVEVLGGDGGEAVRDAVLDLLAAGPAALGCLRGDGARGGAAADPTPAEEAAWLGAHLAATGGAAAAPGSGAVRAAAGGGPREGEGPRGYFARALCARRAAAALRGAGHPARATRELERAAAGGVPAGLVGWLASQPPSGVVELLVGAARAGPAALHAACLETLTQGQLEVLWRAAAGDGPLGAAGEGPGGGDGGDGEGFLFFEDTDGGVAGGGTHFAAADGWTESEDDTPEGDGERGAVDLAALLRGRGAGAGGGGGDSDSDSDG